MNMVIRRLNQAGIEQFSNYLDKLEEDPSAEPPLYILQDNNTSEEIGVRLVCENRKFQNRLEIAEYLDQRLTNIVDLNVEKDVGLWAWLTLFYINSVCPNEKGHRKPGERVRYIPQINNYRKYYRHLLAGPYRIFKAHKNNISCALVVLCQPIDKPGEVVEQLASRQEIITNSAVLEVAGRLYLDSKTNKLKRGTQSKGPGTPRRFVEVLDQYDLTRDLYVISPDELINILPSEFDRFRK